MKLIENNQVWNVNQSTVTAFLT